jgi:tetratricopeptide (TPR) repeat protein
MNSSWVFPLIILPSFYAFIAISLIVSIFLHEIGHAIPALLFTKKRVKIFIGSKENEDCFNFSLGRLKIYFKIRFFYLKNTGACVHDGNITAFEHLIIVISGPLFDFFVSLILFFLSFYLNLHGFIKVFSVFLFSISTIITIASFYPRKYYDKVLSRYIYSDGYQIIYILKSISCNKYLIAGNDFYTQGDYLNAIKFYTKINNFCVNSGLFSTVIYGYIQIKDYQSAFNYINRFSNYEFYKKLSAETYYNISYIQIKLAKFDEALDSLNKSIQLDPQSLSSLNNRAFVNNMLGNFKEAILDTDFGISIDKTFYYFYTTRAYSKIQMNLLEGALRCIGKAGQ